MLVHPTHAGGLADGSACARLEKSLKALRDSTLYDRIAATPLIGWFGFCLSCRLPALAAQIGATDFAAADIARLAGLAAQAATAVFFLVLALLLALRRRPRARSCGLYPRVAAVFGTNLGVAMVLLPPRALPASLSIAATLLALAGTLFAIYAALSLGRSLSMLPEARRLVTSGAYRLVRHPLYLSEAVALVGATLQCLSPLALMLLAVQCMFQLERIKHEEQVLARAFPDYRGYMATTARLVPGFY
ncbi:MAG TPA: isoprenylcysteine carboxylmethyltransferase family protein [Xanthobacteraceae bacterium]|nr:isoprenylcysteine carboxylmethyltransferase family protein [Xanthobacteraceae bacterium]